MTAVSIEERVGRLEGGYDHLATKAGFAEFTAVTRTEFAEFKSAMQAALADLRTATQADIKELEIRLTAAIGQFQIRAMQWTVLFVSVAAGVLVAVDRLLGPAVGG